ncbi:ATP-dependent DNA helicase RecG [Faunimonas pinastri]|uniref:ATP-dependent DNA helicase RecG n=1 Tax=Faunimonas pinastri TaxID=1855383 RepID=A0A1H9JI60_9HYPH|nr:ATP-dependent DNA helicase RecG [Faunimonas pinastri]SEQ86552.1 ATP-dependent DNA helicase RecG [Faunimonas pinastri]
MRPFLLDPLFAPLKTLPGVGPKVEPLLARAVGVGIEAATVRDVLFHLPTGIIDRRARPRLFELPQAGVVTVEGTVERYDMPPPGSRAPWRIILSDGGAALQLIYFNPRPDWLKKTLPIGERRIVSGRLEWFDMRPQMPHPDYIVSPERAEDLPEIEPVYGLTAGLFPKIVRKAVGGALDKLPTLPEWLSADVLSSRDWPPFGDAMTLVHRADPLAGEKEAEIAWQRLAFDELVANQIALALVRGSVKRGRGRSWSFTGQVRDRVLAALPFSPTRSQTEAIGEIETDLASEDRMLRLLQGDVGAGKTLVAMLAMADVAEAGAQSALMAPTDLLARQHYATISRMAEAAGLRSALLTGRDKASERNATLASIASGEIQIVVGTHALFQASVEFHDLGLVVVDEQHRFGVHQRLALTSKGETPDMLVMTATPIPRTLVLSYFGDMDVSKLTEKPAGRQPIDTRTVSLDRLDEVVARIGSAIASGDKAYWVCPLVAESEVLDVAAAEERFVTLQQVFGPVVGLVHGKMGAAEKEAVMQSFRSGDVRVLVATTVIEVGVDVPDATIMVIEHAERFGLAQLHQLRGRVGRGTKPSTCLLLFKTPLGEVARARLTVMRETEDGFRIAEEDLKLRGEGDVLGTRQSGMPGFRIAQAELHGDLLPLARDEAKLALSRDPDFTSPRAEPLRLLLYLFGRDDAVRLMRAG